MNRLKTAIYAALITGLYFSAFQWLIEKDWARDDYSYGMLIPFIVLYLIWEKRNAVFAKPSKPTWSGFLVFIPGMMLFWIGELSGEFFMLYFSSWLIVFGLCWMNMGMEKLKIILFPLFFSLSMFPLPNFINTKLTLQLKLISSKLGVMMLQAYGMSAYREGNVIDLGFTQLQVVDACNGLRYLMPLIVLGIFLTYFFKAALWKKIVLVLTTVPISIIVNSLRIASVGILYQYWGPMVAEGFFHDFSGWSIFMLSLGILLFEMWILKNIFPEKPPQKILNIQAPPEEKQTEVTPYRQTFLKPPQFIVSIALLGIALIISQAVEFREKIPISQPFDQFPLRIEDWTGTRQSMEQKFIDTLDLSDYVIIDYKDPKGKEVNFYVAYYESQIKGESIHSPETCLPGSGWIFQNQGSINIPIAGRAEKTMPVNRAVMEKSGYHQIAYYWFPQRGRILTNAYQLKLYTFWDALTRQRTDGALVRLVTLVYPNEDVSDAEKRMQDFVKDIIPVLDEFIPGE
ncbi:MAG: VPLPA-CTERM-specific exosortase XrtD [Desulfobacteraceae bacterium]|nr:MAG: VPLPA-CTERM-specific exosortase XrtD [Desulfobacteraceae bacterium]